MSTEELLKSLHPGITLKKVIEDRKMNKALFAKDIGIKPSNLSEIFSGKRSISATTALFIERATFIEAVYWMELQMKYDLAVACSKNNSIT